VSTGRNAEGWPALLLGEGLAVLGAARSLAAAGIRPLLLSKPGDFATWTRFATRLAVDRKADLSQLLDVVSLERAVLIPCSDGLVQEAANLPDRFAESFVGSLPPAAAVRTYTDKAFFADAVGTHDVPHPRTFSSVEDVARLSDAEIRGFFLKPRNSQAFSAHYRTKAIPVSGRAEAIEEMERLATEGFKMELQEIIPGPITNHYHLDGFVDRFGRTVAAMARQRIRMYHTDYGNSTMLVSVPMGTLDTAIEPLYRLMRALHHRGIFSAEFKWDERDRLFKLLEINARPWWQVEFATLCGVNVCAMAYHDAIGEELPVISSYDIGQRFRILAQDARAFLDLRKRKAVTLKDWLSSVRGVTDAIIRLSDPLPTLGFAREVAGKLVRRGLRSR
jgi:D-aspartate ligase